MGDQIDEGQINRWIDHCLIDKDIKNYEIEPPKSSEKGEGYTTNVLFVKVNGTKKSNGENVQLDLVLKVGKTFNGSLNESIIIIYKQEMFVYDKVFPIFEQFSKGTKVNEVFNSVPKLFKTFSVDGREMVALINLRTDGYEPHDRMRPMNFDHIKLILKNYARFHAITFAYRDQKPREFKKNFSSYPNVYKEMINDDFKGMFQFNMTRARDLIKEVNVELANKFDGILDKGAPEVLREISETKVEESVITHGDCWNSNFLFKYDNGNKTSPTNAVILDWQLSSLHSPVMDLSYFLFAVSSTEQVAKFPDLLKYYYEQLSDSIKELGSDPNSIFTFSKFSEHWKKYSIFGLIVTLTFLQMLLADTQDVIDFDDMAQASDLMKAITEDNKKENPEFLKRALATSKYYFDLIEK